MKEDLATIYSSHRQGLFTLALSIVGCRQLAEDAIHSAFERLYRSQTSLKGSATSYVYASVRNAAHDVQRANLRTSKAYDSMFAGFVTPPEPNGPDVSLLTEERDEILRAAVSGLQDAEREVVVMKAFGELTFDDIGTILDEPAKTVATRYRRALIRLEEKLRGQL